MLRTVYFKNRLDFFSSFLYLCWRRDAVEKYQYIIVKYNDCTTFYSYLYATRINIFTVNAATIGLHNLHMHILTNAFYFLNKMIDNNYWKRICHAWWSCCGFTSVVRTHCNHFGKNILNFFHSFAYITKILCRSLIV